MSFFEEICKMGENADQFVLNERYDKAEKIYFEIIDKVLETKSVDLFIISKTVLGLLLMYVKQDKIKEAFEIWCKEPIAEDGILGMGIYGLEEKYQVSLHDIIVYKIVSGFISIFGSEDKNNVAKRITSYMEPAVIYGITKDNNFLDLTISNWKEYLMILFEGVIPTEYTDIIKDYEKKIKRVIPLKGINFPEPAKWIVDWADGEYKIGNEDFNE